MTKRITDTDGHRWPITLSACVVCRFPTDAALGNASHPACRPSPPLPDKQLERTLRLLADQLGATHIPPTERKPDAR